jgi:uncharacterized membrane protein
LLPIRPGFCQEYVEYNIQVNDDGSATWRIIQVSDIPAPIDSWTEFQERIINLVDEAATFSHREMNLDSFQIDTSISSEMDSKTTDYTFIWRNFSLVQSQLITIGDVFHVDNFFGKLYGDASLRITYPPGFALRSVSPAPSEYDNQTQTLMWRRTQDFISGKPSVVLTSGNPVEGGISGAWLLYVALGIVGVLGASIGGFYLLKGRRSATKSPNAPSVSIASLIETDEEKIMKIIKSAGGTLRQSSITEQSRFSKAKTSQLLATLEKKEVVVRVKKGRDKIVSLNKK